MNRKQALIVDDSKTAQYLLNRMLQTYDLRIDVAASAEEALAYLSYNHPAVIFLDQQMTGMTGFEALKTIKANPHTALIPVIMYSSQNDDLFVSQAIALGAQGVLSKGAMQPANLQQVLERLNIRMGTAGAAPVPDAPASQTAVAAEPVMEIVATREQATTDAADLDKVRLQVGRLFELHIADIKTHLNNSTQFILKRLSTSIDKAASREASVAGNSLASIKSAVAAALATERRKGSLANRLLLAASIAVTVVFGYLLVQMQADVAASSQKVLAALEAKSLDRSMMTVAAVAPAFQDRAKDVPGSIHPALLQALSWAQHADFHFEYGEQPLSGARLSNLHQLVQLLADGGYRGPLVVNINFGNFCLEQDETNTLRLARSDVRVSNCKMQKDLNAQFLINDYLTLQYQTFEKNLAPLQDGRISIRLVTNGMSTPGVEYPPVTPQVSAGEWNRTALRNNRISVQFPN
ncbi:response regulator [Noviherbaspirillum sedimenti]|uniref:Response regulator n=1 Tax=Noviherbaspirillum sedimenti TaxID=2320865 RepID=A0A3A3G5Z9_9BURK|nr:response regulator [Noviherbaspirillum sedimenti]RJG03878.1 response regulator [Noviherbaspirillum sedimenti]